MIFFKNVVPLLVGSIVNFTMFHIVFNLLFGGDLIFRSIKLKLGKIFMILLAISFVGALVMTFMNIERSMVSAFVGGISGLLVPLQRKNAGK